MLGDERRQKEQTAHEIIVFAENILQLYVTLYLIHVSESAMRLCWETHGSNKLTGLLLSVLSDYHNFASSCKNKRKSFFSTSIGVSIALVFIKVVSPLDFSDIPVLQARSYIPALCQK